MPTLFSINYKVRILCGVAFVLIFSHFYLVGQSMTMNITTPQTLTITTGSSIAQPSSVPNTTCILTYRPPAGYTYRITVQTNLATPKYTLTVTTTNPTRGTSAGTVSLSDGSTAAKNFITGITRQGTTRFTATLTYVASAKYSQGNTAELGNDSHTVTYTFLSP
ncbi:MAG: hypothetical protein ABSB78_00260 [Bacteroidota bacterium]